MNRYYRFPIRFGDLTQRKELPTVDLITSIRQNVYLILTSEFGEYRYDVTYGCSIWDHDFENIVSIHSWKDHMAQSLKNAIVNHESRLSNVRVRIEIDQEERPIHKGDKSIARLKKCVDVHVTGNLKETNQTFNPPPQRLYISPFSFD
jgi:phage baseplate assembly protein W